ncbi:WAT1-related protein At3g18200-like [Beta vulgaris subsp. vulgaris]|uniref:WAT1-related protein At3g18200-like n=1 Tax=Beta vulgaris subsp. vulgaris TaxID=3555 RepID=UPI0020369E77|nr:WAT1-related protein At3g18200-like [Beta vulgaris subsp. vulgaris]
MSESRYPNQISVSKPAKEGTHPGDFGGGSPLKLKLDIKSVKEKLEQVNILSRHGLAKVLGTIASVGGATIITLYKGIPLLQLKEQPKQVNLMAENEEVKFGIFANTTQNFTWGLHIPTRALLLLGWLDGLSASVLKKYPTKLSLTSYTCFFGLVQFLAIAAFTETDYEHWKIASLEEVYTILYVGIVASGLVISLQTWCIAKGDPIFLFFSFVWGPKGLRFRLKTAALPHW